MQTVELAEAKSRLGELVESLTPGDEIVIEKNHKPVARLLPTESANAGGLRPHGFIPVQDDHPARVRGKSLV
jgi:antitoxin (DNA-binding transcriptional repressor) of toxin-antitoxin stability system